MAATATRRQAFFDIQEQRSPLRTKVYDLLRATLDGLTDEEMQDLLCMNPNTQRPRRGELQKAGLIKDSCRVRVTKSGRNAVIWVAVVPKEGKQHLMWEV